MRLEPEDLIYSNKAPVVVGSKEESKSADNRFVMLRPKKAGLYEVVRSKGHAAVVDVDGLDNVTSTNRASLARTTREDGTQDEGTRAVSKKENLQETTSEVGG